MQMKLSALPSWKQLVGCDSCELISSKATDAGAPQIHRGVTEAFESLCRDARNAGFDIQVVSGYRSFERQLKIWNAKASGQRVLLNEQGAAMDYAAMDQQALLHAIMRWSALPGTSRHHWGTDIDIYDALAVPSAYQVQLSPQEVNQGGVFDALHCWLDQRIQTGESHGFFRPYEYDRGGVAPERWHLSYAPLAGRYQYMQDPAAIFAWLSELKKNVDGESILLLDVILGDWDVIFERYVRVPLEAYPDHLRHYVDDLS
jgi:LAS superfamily LD-carboxypeptidase LdcB